MRSSKEIIADAIDNTYFTFRYKLVPQTVSSLYSFCTGVAIITSAAAIIGRYLSYFALAISIAITGPIAVITGLILAYLQHLDFKEKSTKLNQLHGDVSKITLINKTHEDKLAKYFEEKSSKSIATQKSLSSEIGKLTYQKQLAKNQRSWGSWLFDITTRYVTDAGLTFGVTFFILTTFTSIPFVGMPLILTIVGCLCMAALSSYFIHTRKYRYEEQMDSYKHEYIRQNQISNLFKTIKLPEEKAAPNADSVKHNPWDNDDFHNGFYKEMLNNIYAAINKYLVDKEIIQLAEYHDKNTIHNQIYSVSKDRLPKNISTTINDKLKYNNKNIKTAFDIAKLIEDHEMKPKNYLSLLLYIKQIRLRARNQSIFSCIGCGSSQLADRIDEIFERASKEAMVSEQLLQQPNLELAAQFNKQLEDDSSDNPAEAPQSI